MRKTFINTLCGLAEKNNLIWLLSGDLGFSVLEQFEQKFPNRYINTGVAEQNMAGIATGIALSGNTVFIYSIANFPIFRCLEQIRNDICYHNADVKIVSVGGGMAYGSAGYSHHGIEDIGIMRLLPGMTVICPADPIETELATIEAANRPGPFYLRLGKSNEPAFHKNKLRFKLDQAILYQKGSDITLIANGPVLGLAIQAAAQLESKGISTEIISSPVIEPFDKETLIQSVKKTGRIISIEEHGPGALSSVIAENIAGTKCQFAPICLNKQPLTTAGSQDNLRKMHKLTTENIINTAVQMFGK